MSWAVTGGGISFGVRIFSDKVLENDPYCGRNPVQGRRARRPLRGWMSLISLVKSGSGGSAPPLV
jgi:hypothetical protein